MEGQQRILVIEDDLVIQKLLLSILCPRGYAVETASSGEEGLRLFFASRPHLVLLDILLPGIDGFETCTRILQLTEVPVIFLSAMDGENYVVQGLEAGAVDYIKKPFGMKELVARIRSALRYGPRTSDASTHPAYDDGYLAIDLQGHGVHVQGNRIELTATEYNVLAFLLENAGRVLTFQQILEHVWGWEYQDSTHYIYTYIRHLRRKLEPKSQAPRYFVSEHGVGYRFVRHD